MFEKFRGGRTQPLRFRSKSADPFAPRPPIPALAICTFEQFVYNLWARVQGSDTPFSFPEVFSRKRTVFVSVEAEPELKTTRRFRGFKDLVKEIKRFNRNGLVEPRQGTTQPLNPSTSQTLNHAKENHQTGNLANTPPLNPKARSSILYAKSPSSVPPSQNGSSSLFKQNTAQTVSKPGTFSSLSATGTFQQLKAPKQSLNEDKNYQCPTLTLQANDSTPQPLNASTPQPRNSSTSQRLINSLSQPIDTQADYSIGPFGNLTASHPLLSSMSPNSFTGAQPLTTSHPLLPASMHRGSIFKKMVEVKLLLRQTSAADFQIFSPPDIQRTAPGPAPNHSRFTTLNTAKKAQYRLSHRPHQSSRLSNYIGETKRGVTADHTEIPGLLAEALKVDSSRMPRFSHKSVYGK